MAGHEDNLAPETIEEGEDTQLQERVDMFNQLLETAQAFVNDPQVMIDTMKIAVDKLATDINNSEFADASQPAELSELDQLTTDIFLHFMACYNPNGISQEALEQQLQAIIETARIDDGWTTPQEVL
ncbi:MAG: hypothetical protein AB8B83_09465 [Bdellovibrionales bacterium]